MAMVFSVSEVNQYTTPNSKWLRRLAVNFIPSLKDFIGKKINFLEIGVFAGSTSRWLLGNILTHPESKLVGIDPWERGYFGRRDVRDDKNWNDILNSVESVEKDFGSKVDMIKGYSYDVLLRDDIKGIKFDGIYIDGDHTYDSVIKDFDLSWPLLNIGGVLIFDDYLLKDRSTGGYFLGMQKSINKILSDHIDEYNLLFKNRQVGIRKTK
jgi:predicted O-methyltransferase YrrM